MVEPVNLWQPQTDKYKEIAAHAPAPEVELKQRLEELHKNKPKEHYAEKKAPIAIRVLTWFYFLRAGAFLALFLVLVYWPQSGASNWLAGNLGQFLRMPTSSAQQAAAERAQFEEQAAADGYELSPDQATGQDREEQEADSARRSILVYLVSVAAVSTVVAFMWLFRSWKIRWVTMCYAGGFLAKAAINYLAGLASGVGSQIPASQSASLLFTIALNGTIFCYLAFWPGVKELFEPGT